MSGEWIVGMLMVLWGAIVPVVKIMWWRLYGIADHECGYDGVGYSKAVAMLLATFIVVAVIRFIFFVLKHASNIFH